ncbi:hypothetical protein G6321_00024440 [Bradyrhizobium barranii subsp. barranii]|uniref:Uncharacterized protein n=1 Tax=Bradyrhizobium barranii subsp. barranii TaxID=2823807 RepID=A0A7Z0QIF6_9BRAD|nr:hypothetical protein [Bradyrhizobium barranii]UGX98101.1 hypothetical protein G6321_00024440 [Bradyrhizobium barranii subsp. barranii]
MFNRKVAPVRLDQFISAKATSPIPARHPALRDALIQASLDPHVRSIVYVPSASVATQKVELDAIALQCDDGRFLLDVVPARRIRTSEEQQLAQIAVADLGLKSMVLTAEEVRREPRFTNGRLVWSHRYTPVPVGLRLRILLALRDEGPMPLGELLKSILSEVDPAPAVMALACANLVELDLLSQPLGPITIVSYSAQSEIP